jgi:hypothetical protein
LSRITKHDFSRLFWLAYQKAFNQDYVESDWHKTGLYPFDPAAVLSIFEPEDYGTSTSWPSTKSVNKSVLALTDRRKVQTLVKESVSGALDERDQKNYNKLMNTILTFAAELTIQRHIDEGLEAALLDEKKRRKCSKNVFEELHAEDGFGATFFSPNKI